MQLLELFEVVPVEIDVAQSDRAAGARRAHGIREAATGMLHLLLQDPIYNILNIHIYNLGRRLEQPARLRTTRWGRCLALAPLSALPILLCILSQALFFRSVCVRHYS